MRIVTAVKCLTGLAAAMWLAGAMPARAEDAASPPPDPTRGQWDAFLDPLRDFEDSAITGTQKSIEDATKIHIGAGFTEAYMWDFNNPRSGSLIALHSIEHHNDGVPAFSQLSFGRPSDGWWVPGFGLKLDAGKGARDIKSDWNGNGGVRHGDTFETNDFDAEEAYLYYTLADTGTPLDGLNVKGGKFVTTAGAEVIEPWLNYNFSRSFLFGLAIPFTHTGVLATYPITDKLSVGGGLVAGWDQVASNNNSPTFMTNAAWTATDQISLAGTILYGPSQTNNVGNKRQLYDLVATLKPCDPLTVVLNYDYGQEDEASLSGGTAKWQGFAAIANYQFTDRFSVALRGEWFEDHGGSRTGTRQTLYEGTATAKYLITQHLYGQLEARRDNGSRDTFEDGSHGELAGGQTIFGMAVGWVFN